MPKVNVDYSKSLIYKIVCNDLNVKDLYIGSTTDLTKRKCHHKTCCNNPNDKKYNRNVYKFIRENGGWDNFSVVLVEKYPCEDKLELLKRERYWTETLNANLNSIKGQGLHIELGHKDYNKLNYESNKEHYTKQHKEYYENNKEKIQDYHKQYRENNKEYLKDQSKEYREKNKDRIKEKKNKQIVCACGCHHTYGNKNRHEKSKNHQNFIKNQQEV